MSSRRSYVSLRLLSLILFLLTAALGVHLLSSVAPPPKVETARMSATSFPIVAPTLRYGVALDTFHLSSDTIEYGETLSELLFDRGLSREQAYLAALRFNEMLDVRQLRAGRTLEVLDDPDTEGPDLLVYQPNVYRYLRLDLQDPRGERDELREFDVNIQTQTAYGEIESSLWNAIVGNGHSFALAEKMEDALQWSVDFYHVQLGDRFELVYEQEYVEGQEAGLGRVRAAHYATGGKDIWAFYFESADTTQRGYYGMEGEPMKSTFLKAPVKYSRISSRYNLRRFHPIQRRVKPHLGTDYAAPYGTPIVAVADGTVSRSGRTGGNGIFVKIKHDKRFSTQYLHMQKRAPGMTVGRRVEQGEVIGYVGSTGLATGPHVCFRFWDNGRQVDHTRIDFKNAEPMPEEYLPEFFEVRDRYLTQLQGSAK